MASFSHRAELAGDRIRATPRTLCGVCGSIGVPLYSGLTDEFFGAAGSWNFSRCLGPQCGLLWLNPMPHADDIWKAYRNYYPREERVAPATTSRVRLLPRAITRAHVGVYLGYLNRNPTMRERALRVLAWPVPARRADPDFPLKYLPLRNRGRILDIGRGSGALLESFGWRAERIDSDPIVVAAARRNGLEVYAGSLLKQKLPDASFDGVVMSHFIEYVHHPLELLQETRRILKPGRRLVIATPNAASLGHRILREEWPFLDPPRHLQVFTPRALKRLALAAGFKGVRIRTEVRTAAAMLPLLRVRNTASASSPKLSPMMRRSLVAGRLLAYGEELARHFDRESGEEIALVAVR